MRHPPQDLRADGTETPWPNISMLFVGSCAATQTNSEWLQLVFQAILLLGAKHLIFRVDAENLEHTTPPSGEEPDKAHPRLTSDTGGMADA